MVDLTTTIPDIVIQAASRWGDLPAINDQGEIITFTELEQNSRLAARAFISNGLAVGDRFSIWAPNIHEWIWVAIGGMMAGGVLVPLNTRYKGIEASDILDRSGVKLLFTVCGFLDTDYPKLLQEHKPKSIEQTILLRGDNAQDCLLSSFLQSAEQTAEDVVDSRIDALRGDSISDIMYTSGTTGSPKGVMSSHGQVVAIFKKWASAVGLSESDKYLIVNPFFHTFGYKSGWLTCLLTGATAYPEPVFNASEILKILARERITMLPGAPTIFQSLLEQPSLKDTDLSHLRCAVTGAASVPEQLVRDMKNVLGFKQVYTGYGLTECGVVSICRDGDDFETIANTAGRAIDGIQVKVVDEDGGDVEPGDIGNIMVKGFNVMQGYFDDQQASKEAIDQQGWLDTGDIGWQDKNGYIKITDRAKDLFICGGFNCYPAEIESLLFMHEQIVDVAVTGVKDERLGEVARAHIVVAAGKKLSHEELKSWCREHMANYKVPRSFSFIDELPRNASGKVQKFMLDSVTNGKNYA
jgi:acyl-CoA synthetase (AMP-forming)/AMP-acid ligase II